MTKPATSATPADYFDQDMAAAYDRRNSGLKPISECLHFLMRLVLDELPDDARLLCVGVGTGAEILSLAKDRPGWTFVGVDPSQQMLEVGRSRLEQAGVLDRCDLVPGYVEDVAEHGFDAAIALLVAHFILRADRPAYYGAIHERLKPGGRFVSAEISCKLDGEEFPAKLRNWEQVQKLMGATPDTLASLPETLRNVLGIVSPEDTVALWRDAGFTPPIDFFQAFMIRGWHAKRA